MRKLTLVLALAVLLAMGGVPAGATHEGCMTGGATSYTTACNYTASGPGTYRAATLNAWEIFVIRQDIKVVLANSPVLSGVKDGPVASEAGEVVRVVISNRPCPDPSCYVIGVVWAGHPQP